MQKNAEIAKSCHEIVFLRKGIASKIEEYIIMGKKPLLKNSS
jgi:hypothetical protein